MSKRGVSDHPLIVTPRSGSASVRGRVGGETAQEVEEITVGIRRKENNG